MTHDWPHNKRPCAELDLSNALIYNNAYATAGGSTCSESSYGLDDDSNLVPPFVVCCDGAELNLARNSTSYVAYTVSAPSVARFNVSITFTASGTSGHTVASTVYIQPWDSYPAAASSSSSTVPIITGSIQLSGIKSEDYSVLTSGQPINGDGDTLGYALIQTSLEDAGEANLLIAPDVKHTNSILRIGSMQAKLCVCLPGILVDNYYLGDYANCMGITDDTWARTVLQHYDVLDGGSPCPESPTDAGYATCMAPLGSSANPYGEDWTAALNGGPVPDPSAQVVAADPNNQLAWFQENVWAYSSQSPHPLPYSPAQYSLNSVAANVVSGSDATCRFLFNIRSLDQVPVTVLPAGDTVMTYVNTAHAIACNYEGNTMTATTTATGQDFGFAQGTAILDSNHSQPPWGPGFLYGDLLLELQNQDNIAQLVQVTPGSCCMTAPSLDCSAAVTYAESQTLLIPSGYSTTLSFPAQTNFFGPGYCNISVSHIWHDASAATGTHDFIEQIFFVADAGGPVTCSVSARIAFVDIEQNWYVQPGLRQPVPANSTALESLLFG